MANSLYQRLFAFGMCHGFRRYRRLAEPHLRVLLAEPAGRVIEVGCGTGRNLALLSGLVTRWVGIDRNPHMLRYARDAARQRGMPAGLALMDGAQMGFPDNTFDAVVSVLLLCSVPDPARVLAEIRRVLRPGGRFYFFEHVAAEPHSRLHRWQQRTAPLWRHIGDGCSPTRPTLASIEAAGFARVEARPFALPVPIFSPHIAGWCSKKVSG